MTETHMTWHITWLKHTYHITETHITWLKNTYHMTETYISHDWTIHITWLKPTSHDWNTSHDWKIHITWLKPTSHDWNIHVTWQTFTYTETKTSWQKIHITWKFTLLKHHHNDCNLYITCLKLTSILSQDKVYIRV